MTSGWQLRAGAGSSAAVLALALLSASPSSSYLYDLERVGVSAETGEWETLPAACGGGPKHPHTTIIRGTPLADTLTASGTAPPQGDDDDPNFAQVVLGLGGNDTLTGGNEHDCLIGGEGDDVLVGKNGNDVLDGGPGHDTCLGGNGTDVIVNCEVVDPGNGPADNGAGGGPKPKEDEGTKSGASTTEAPPPPTVEEPKEPEVEQPEPPAEPEGGAEVESTPTTGEGDAEEQVPPAEEELPDGEDAVPGDS